MPNKQGDEEIETHFVWHQSEGKGAVPLLFSAWVAGESLEGRYVSILCTYWF
jgi:hypothetical protein